MSTKSKMRAERRNPVKAARKEAKRVLGFTGVYDLFGYAPTPERYTLEPGGYRRYLSLLNSMPMADGNVVDLLSRNSITEADGWSSVNAVWKETFQGYMRLVGPAGSDVVMHMSHAVTTLRHPTLGSRTIRSVLYARIGLGFHDTTFIVTYPDDIAPEHEQALQQHAMNSLMTTHVGRLDDDLSGYVWLRYPKHTTFANSAPDDDWRETDVPDSSAPAFPALAGYTA